MNDDTAKLIAEARQYGNSAPIVRDLADALKAAEAELEVTVNAKTGLAKLSAQESTRANAAEAELRKEWWLNHGHDSSVLYGDDGEMQCVACPADYKRQPMDELRQIVLVARAALTGSGEVLPTNNDKEEQ